VQARNQRDPLSQQPKHVGVGDDSAAGLTATGILLMGLSEERKAVLTSADGVTLDARIIHVQSSRGAILLVHGFSVDLHEEGTFDTLAERLAKSGLSAVRFSFRGQGESDGTQEEMTISGERLDFLAAYDALTKQVNPPYGIVAASFGAVSTLLELGKLQPRPGGLVLWNPVLDIESVFVHPTTPWGRLNFGQKAFDIARRNGYIVVDGVFRAGDALFKEMRLYPGNLGLLHLQGIPTVIFHGTEDTYVPLATSRSVSALRNVQVVEVPGSDHGFPAPENEERVVSQTVAWFDTLFPRR